MEQGYPLKIIFLDKLKITVSISNCKRMFSITYFAKSHEKHLVIEWLLWWQNKRYLINFTFYETFMDEPVPRKISCSTSRESWDTWGGFVPTSPPPPPGYPMWVPKPFAPEGLSTFRFEKKLKLKENWYFSSVPIVLHTILYLITNWCMILIFKLWTAVIRSEFKLCCPNFVWP